MRIQKIRNVKTPSRGTIGSAGIDFYIPEGNFDRYELAPGESILIPSGIIAKVPYGYALIAMEKSGVAVNKHLSVGARVVDSDYQGEIGLHVFNRGSTTVNIYPGEKLVQFLLIHILMDEVEIVESAWEEEKTERGMGGYGSTGTN